MKATPKNENERKLEDATRKLFEFLRDNQGNSSDWPMRVRFDNKQTAQEFRDHARAVGDALRAYGKGFRVVGPEERTIKG